MFNKQESPVIIILNQNADAAGDNITVSQATAYIINLPSLHRVEQEDIPAGRKLVNDTWPVEPDITIKIKDKPSETGRGRRIQL